MTGSYQPDGMPEPHDDARDPAPLEVRAVTVRFAGLTALSEVSFTVAPGSVHAVIGPNGAGKSTCFNVLSGVYTAAAGSVRFGGAGAPGGWAVGGFGERGAEGEDAVA